MSSEIEQPPFASAPVTTLSANVILQPPLSRPGIGPGIVIFLPKSDRVGISSNSAEIHDPEPPTKWAKEGFAVVAITDFDGLVVEDVLKQALDSLQSLDKVDVKDKFAVIVHEPRLVRAVSEAASKEPRVACFVGYGLFASRSLTIPIVLHLTANAPRPANAPSDATTIYTYTTSSAFFVLPQSPSYNANDAAQANSRTLEFIRKWLDPSVSTYPGTK